MSAKLERTTFSASRAAEYVEASQLQAVTGQAKPNFAGVVIKELADNALDACEEAGVAPKVGIEVTRTGGEMAIVVSDNGTGVPPKTVRDALDFSVRVSDKAAYRSPTRGAQGNALKTVFGIPPALGSLEPVVVEARGLRHEIRVWKDPAGELRVQCDDTASPVEVGTKVALAVPEEGQDLDPGYWGKAFSIFNPHAAVRIVESQASNLGESPAFSFVDSYHPTRDPAKRFKYVPSDPTSAHWYRNEDLERLVYSHNAHARGGGRDLPLREFVRQFRGLSSTAKAKAVCDHMGSIKTLSDFEGAEAGAIGDLLHKMRFTADAPSHNVLGYVGREHFEQRFEEFYGGVSEFGYKKIKGNLPSELPYIFEFAVAEIDAPGHLFTGVNFSPTFGDPLSDVWFRCAEYGDMGVENFVYRGFAHPEIANHGDPDPPFTAVAMHVVTPAPLFLDRGKTRLEGFGVPGVAGEVARAMFGPIKPLYKKGRRRVRTSSMRERTPKKAGTEVSFKDAIYASMEQAVLDASSGGEYPFSARDLFYAVRPLYVDHTSKRLDPENGYNTFKGILDAYQEEHGKIEGLYYDPRGRLREPHSGHVVDVGTREIEAYSFPRHTFDKILYVEKEGIWPQLEAHNLAERYDMAILTGKGYATEAARTLFEKAEKGNYQLFVLHDADPDGYNIARTLSEETRRMPGYSVEVIDIGLTVEDAEDRGLLPETFTRKKSLPTSLVLDERELACFEGRYKGTSGAGNGKKLYECTRYEINALKTAPEKISYIEEKLEEKGVRGKVIPPEDELPGLARSRYLALTEEWIVDAVREIVIDDDFTDAIADQFRDKFELDEARSRIEQRFEEDHALSWREALDDALEEVRDKHRDAIKASVREAIEDALTRPDVSA